MPFIETDDINIYYEKTGEGPSLIFAHGFAGNHLSWWQQIPFFSQSYECVTYDQRSFGLTKDNIDSPMGRTKFGDDLKSLLDNLNIDKTNIVSHSMGARSAISFALKNPERVTSVVISGSNGGSTNDKSRDIRKHHLINVNNNKQRPKALSDSFIISEPEKTFLFKQIMRINPHHKKDFLSVNPNLNTSTSLKLNESKIPILFMVGNEDTLVNPETIKIASDLIVNSQFIGLDGVGHSVYYEKPDLYNKLVMGFLKKHQLEHQTLH